MSHSVKVWVVSAGAVQRLRFCSRGALLRSRIQLPALARLGLRRGYRRLRSRLAQARAHGPRLARPAAGDRPASQRSTSTQEAERLVWRMDGRVTGELPIINGLVARMSAANAYRLAHEAGVPRRLAERRGQEELGLDRHEAARDLVQRVGPGPAGLGRRRDRQGRRRGGDRHRHRRQRCPTSASPSPTARSRVVATAVTNPYATNDNDSYGHGTHVAGIIAGNGERPPEPRPARRQVRGRCARRQPDLGQGRRREGRRDRARRHLRPAVRRRQQGRPTTSASSTSRWSRRRPSPTRPTRSTRRPRRPGSTGSSWSRRPVTAAPPATRSTTRPATTPT